MTKRAKRTRKKLEFSKIFMILQMLIVFYISWRVLGFVDKAIDSEFTGSLPYLTTFISVVWAAQGTWISFYMNKSKGENVEKIKGSFGSCSSTQLDPAPENELDDPENTPDIIGKE